MQYQVKFWKNHSMIKHLGVWTENRMIGKYEGKKDSVYPTYVIWTPSPHPPTPSTWSYILFAAYFYNNVSRKVE